MCVSYFSKPKRNSKRNKKKHQKQPKKPLPEAPWEASWGDSGSLLGALAALGALLGGSETRKTLTYPHLGWQNWASLDSLGHIYDNLEPSRAHFEASRHHFGSLGGQSGIILGTFLATACFKTKLEGEVRATQTLWARA